MTLWALIKQILQGKILISKILGAAGICLGLSLGTTISANASTVEYAFSFTGTAYSGSGDIFVGSNPVVSNGYDITGITGSINGPSPTFGVITNLDTQPGTPNATGLYTDPATGNQWLYNDVLYTSGVPFDYYGALFSFGNSGQYIGNIYSIGTQLYLSVSQGAYFYPGDPINLSVSQTPLPAAALLFGSGLAGLSLLRRRRKKSLVAARA